MVKLRKILVYFLSDVEKPAADIFVMTEMTGDVGKQRCLAHARTADNGQS